MMVRALPTMLLCALLAGNHGTVAAERPVGPRVDLYGDPLPDGALMRLGTVRFRHEEPFFAAIGFASDGKRVFTRSSWRFGSTIPGGWDVATGKPIPIATGPATDKVEGAVPVTIMTAGGQQICFFEPALARLLDEINKKEKQGIEGGAPLFVALSADGKRLAAAGRYRGLALWDPATGKEIRRIDVSRVYRPGTHRFLALAPDARTALVNHYGTVVAWDLETGQDRYRLSMDPTLIAIAPDGKTFVATSYSGPIGIYTLADGKRIRELAGDAALAYSAMAFSPDGRWLVTATYFQLFLWEAATGKLLARRSRLCDLYNSGPLVFSPDGKLLASGERGCLRLRDPSRGLEDVHASNGHLGAVWGVAFAPDGTALASSSNDGTVRVWDLATGRERHCLRRPEREVPEWFHWLAFSADGKKLAAGVVWDTVGWWDVQSGRPLPESKIAGGSYSTRSLLLPHQETFARAEGKQVFLIAAATEKERVAFSKHADDVLALACSADGKLLASVARDGLAHCRKIETLELVGSFKVMEPLKKASFVEQELGSWPQIAVSPDGGTLAVSTSGKAGASLWQIATGKRIVTCADGLNGPCGLVFSPDGQFLAAHQGREILLWETVTGKAAGKFSLRADNRFPAMAFSPDGKVLATGHADSSILLWPVPSLRK